MIALDLETTSLDTKTCDIVAVSLSLDGKSARVLPTLEEALIYVQDKEIVVHNAAFDVAILDRFGVHRKGKYWDTMISGYILGAENVGLKDRALRELGIEMQEFDQLGGKGSDASTVPWDKLAPYAGHDAAMTYRLFEKDVKGIGTDKRRLFDLEQELTWVLADMSDRGFLINTERLEEFKTELSDRMVVLHALVIKSVGHDINPESTQQIEKLLFEELRLKPGKKTKSKARYAVDDEVLKGLRGQHPVIEHLLNYRSVSKLLGTYVEGIYKHIGPDGCVHSRFKQTGTRTSRLSSADPNLQNQPNRTAEGRRIKRIFVARHGKWLCSFDLKQIELVTAAALSGDPTMLGVFQRGEDIHEHTRIHVLHGQGDRTLSKSVNFGSLYRLEPAGLVRYLASECEPPMIITMQQAKAIIDGLLNQYPVLRQWQDRIVEDVKVCGYTETALGFRRYYPGVQYVKGYALEDILKAAVASPVQGTAAIIIKQAMVKLKGYPMLVQVHDDLVFELDDVTEGLDIARAMREAGKEIIGIETGVEIKYGKDWGSLISLGEL